MLLRGYIIYRLVGFLAVNAVAIWAAMTDATWMAAGTFVVTLGGVVKMIYGMQIEAARDRSKVDLERAKERIEELDKQARQADADRLTAIARAETVITAAKAEGTARFEALKAEFVKLSQEMRAERGRPTPTPDKG